MADPSRFRSYNYQTTAHLGTNIMSWQGVQRQVSNPLQSTCTWYPPSPSIKPGHLSVNFTNWQGVERQVSYPLQSNCTGHLISPPTNQAIWMLISQVRKVYSGNSLTKIKLKSPTSRRKSDDVGNTKPKPHRWFLGAIFQDSTSDLHFKTLISKYGLQTPITTFSALRAHFRKNRPFSPILRNLKSLCN